MALVTLHLPSPKALRGGWAALASICAARGWDDVSATPDEWRYHDGGGNWAYLRFQPGGRAVLLGNDHEYTDTYYGAAAAYFGEEETDILAGAPDWWSANLDPAPGGEWVGFVYGWDGQRWQRAAYDKQDGFRSVGLLGVGRVETLRRYAEDAPGLRGVPDPDALAVLVAADGDITAEVLERVVPGWDVAAGIEMGRRFLLNGGR